MATVPLPPKYADTILNVILTHLLSMGISTF